MGFTINEDRGGAIARLLFLTVLVMAGLPWLPYMEDVLIDSVLMEGKGYTPQQYAVSSVRKIVTSQISHYKVLEKIGEGGMGEVYLTSISHFGITLRRLFQLW